MLDNKYINSAYRENYRLDQYRNFLYNSNYENSVIYYAMQRLSFLENDSFENSIKKILQNQKKESKKIYNDTINPLRKYLNNEKIGRKSTFNELIKSLKSNIEKEFTSNALNKEESIFKNLKLTANGLKDKKKTMSDILKNGAGKLKNLENRVKALDSDLKNIKETFKEIENLQQNNIKIDRSQNLTSKFQKYYTKIDSLYNDISQKDLEFHKTVLADYTEIAAAKTIQETLQNLEKSIKTIDSNSVKLLQGAKIDIMGGLKEKIDTKVTFKIPGLDGKDIDVFIGISNKATQNLEEMNSNKLVNMGGFIDALNKTKKLDNSIYNKYLIDYHILSNLYFFRDIDQINKIKIFNILEKLSRYIAAESTMEALGLNASEPVLFIQIGNKLYTGEEIYTKALQETPSLFFYVGEYRMSDDFFILKRKDKKFSTYEEMKFRRENKTKQILNSSVATYMLYVQQKVSFNNMQLFLRKSKIGKR